MEAEVAEKVAMTIRNGAMNSLKEWAFIRWKEPIIPIVNLLVVILNWRAICGKSARTVWREGRRKPMRLLYPYQKLHSPSNTG